MAGEAADRKFLSRGADAYAAIRREIRSGGWKGGEVVNESGLAGRLGLTKTPVRDAMLRLTAEGLVRAIPRVGYVLEPVTLQQAVEVFQVRLILEPETWVLMCRAASRDSVAALSARMEDDRFARCCRDVHAEVALRAGNAKLSAMVDSLLDEGERIARVAGSGGVSAADGAAAHRRLAQAVGRWDAEQAHALAVMHLVAMREDVLAHLRERWREGLVSTRAPLPS